jgi:3-oxoacyl-(acyl-carrier-protein) synthase
MRAALADAGLEAGDVGYVSAHGTGTKANDRVEAHALREVFGAHADGLPVSSIKSMLGHLQGAAGALESIACLLALREQMVPPTVHFEQPDPECPIDVVPNHARSHRLSFAMNNAFGFGGACSVLVFGGIG